MDERKS